MSVVRAVEVSDITKRELIRRTLVEDVQRRTIARVAMSDCVNTIRLYEAKLGNASLEAIEAERVLDEHLLDYSEAIGLGEPLPQLESD